MEDDCDPVRDVVIVMGVALAGQPPISMKDVVSNLVEMEAISPKVVGLAEVLKIEDLWVLLLKVDELALWALFGEDGFTLFDSCGIGNHYISHVTACGNLDGDSDMCCTIKKIVST